MPISICSIRKRRCLCIARWKTKVTSIPAVLCTEDAEAYFTSTTKRPTPTTFRPEPTNKPTPLRHVATFCAEQNMPTPIGLISSSRFRPPHSTLYPCLAEESTAPRTLLSASSTMADGRCPKRSIASRPISKTPSLSRRASRPRSPHRAVCAHSPHPALYLSAKTTRRAYSSAISTSILSRMPWERAARSHLTTQTADFPSTATTGHPSISSTSMPTTPWISR